MPQVGLTDTPQLPSYEEILQEWLPKAVSMARGMKLPEPEEAAQAALLKFWEMDYLARYEPGHGCSLNTWIYRGINLKLMGERRTQFRHATREVPCAPLVDEDGIETSVVDDTYYEAAYGFAESAGVYDAIVEALRHFTLPDESLPLSDLLEAILACVEDGETPTNANIADRLKVPSATVRARRPLLVEKLWRIPEAAPIRHLFPEQTEPKVHVWQFLTMTNMELRPLVRQALGKIGAPKALGYYMRKSEKAEVVASVIAGEDVEPDLLAHARAEYAAHKASRVAAKATAA